MFEENFIFDTPMLHADGNHWSHLAAKDIDSLHEFAVRIGLKKEYFQDKPGRPHYDIKSEKFRQRALLLGAKMVNRPYLVDFLKHYNEK